MADYQAPIQEMSFLLEDVIGLSDIDTADILDHETIDAVLNEAGKLARDVLGPLNAIGDTQHPTLDNDAVTTTAGWKEAYAAYCEGGWNAVPFHEDFGGQGLPWLLAFPIQEMWQASNMAFGLCPLLNQGAIKAIHAHGSDEQKSIYLEKLISGKWTGTMNLTESQAGSDLSAIRSKAMPQEDGSFKISGQKIFITYGEHDLTENIIHLVLARTPGAPEGVKGISLFIVPKFIPDAQGNPDIRNDVTCTGLEHKIGIHASPTCTMSFGDNGGATGYLVGEENQGLKYMFTMMNNARLSVGLQGVAIADRAYQHANSYAKERIQGASLTSRDKVSIDKHADVQRMLLSMRGQIQACRTVAYESARSLDLAAQGKRSAQEHVELMTPIVKAWATDMAVQVTSTAIQVIGGMGYIEETGAGQFYRDARILPIYEGTNGIQAADFVFRKVLMDEGNILTAWLLEKEAELSRLSALSDPRFAAVKNLIPLVAEAMDTLKHSARRVLLLGGNERADDVAFVSTDLLKIAGIVAGSLAHVKICHQIVQSEKYAKDFVAINEQIETSCFYLCHETPLCSGISDSIRVTIQFRKSQA